MRRLLPAFAAVLTVLMLPAVAEAAVLARIDRSSQTMKVYVDGYLRHEWPVSTGKRGYSTPTGSYRPQRLEPRWYSRKYNNSPMHNAVFFSGGYAIHATTYVGQLGRAASHGCVRLHPAHAREFFSLVRQYGRGGTRISITQ